MLYFIVNQTSKTGKGGQIWEELEKIILDRGIHYQVYFTAYPGHAAELAAEISGLKDRNKCLVIAGGDGTINEALNGITNFADMRVGVIPIGSGNDFVRGSGLEKDPFKALRRILDLAERGPETCCPTDLGRVKADQGKVVRTFAISSGFGMDAIVSRKALTSPLKTLLNKVHMGKLTYILITVYTLFSMDTATARCRYYNERNEVIHEEVYHKLIFMAAMNTYAEGGGVPMAPKADPADAMLSLCTAYGIPKWRTFFCLPLLMMKKHEKLKGFQVRNCDHARIILSKPMTLHMDGEYGGEVSRIEFQCLPLTLRLLK